MWLVYFQCYFVSIASILGTGILGLPVTLARGGFYPFVCLFLLCFVMQSLLVYYFVDLLQKTQLHQSQMVIKMNVENEPLKSPTEEYGAMEEALSSPSEDTVELVRPDLHMVGATFLPPVLLVAFDVCIAIHFVSILISYALAGSQAYAQLLHVEYMTVIPIFCWLLAVVIVFARPVLEPVVSVLTFLKGGLLITVVVVTFLVGSAFSRRWNNDVSQSGESYLMGTVALGGVVNVLPMLYGKLSNEAHQIRNFRRAVLLAVATCALLNMLWCWAVLRIVPQSCEFVAEEACNATMTLVSASQRGLISTVPLTLMIEHERASFSWLAWLIQAFIMLSITVSFLIMGGAMYHTLAGCVHSLLHRPRLQVLQVPLCNKACLHWFSGGWLLEVFLALAAFGAVFTVSMLNPKGFVSLLSRVASLFLNLEAGLFISVMVWRAFRPPFRQLDIRVGLHRVTEHAQYVLPVYFNAAVLFDVYVWISSGVLP